MSAPKAGNHKLLDTEQESSIEDDSILDRGHYLCPEPVGLERSMSAMQNTFVGDTYFRAQDPQWRRRTQT